MLGDKLVQDPQVLLNTSNENPEPVKKLNAAHLARNMQPLSESADLDDEIEPECKFISCVIFSVLFLATKFKSTKGGIGKI